MITITTEQPSGRPLKEEVDQDIQQFDEYFRGLGNEPLTKSERAVLSTYLWWHTQVVKKQG